MSESNTIDRIRDGETKKMFAGRQREDILNTVRKMLDLAQDSSNVHAADIALAKAQKAMEEHNISMADILEEEMKKAKAEFATLHVLDWQYQNIPAYYGQLIVAVCDLFDCKARIVESPKHYYPYQCIAIYGYKVDAQVAEWAFTYLVAEMKKRYQDFIENVFNNIPARELKARKLNKASAGISFQKGVVRELINRIHELQDSRKQILTSSGTDLMVIKEQHIVAQFGEFKYVKRSSKVKRDIAYAHGQEAGKDIDLRLKNEEA